LARTLAYSLSHVWITIQRPFHGDTTEKWRAPAQY
jgi:hypothetical protein